jgi:hypothetical protein
VTLGFKERMDAAEAKRSQDRAEAIAFFGEGREYVNPHKGKGSNRPICPYCNKPYGVRATKYTDDRYAVGQPIPPYDGNHMIVTEIVSVGGGMGPNHGPGAAVMRTTWDGVSYRSTSWADPFCSKLCGFNFALAAYRGGYRIIRED